MWAAAYLSKHEEDFKQVIQNLEVWKIETIFGIVQAQISNLKHRDHARCGLEEEVDTWSLENSFAAGSKDCHASHIKSACIQ